MSHLFDSSTLCIDNYVDPYIGAYVEYYVENYVEDQLLYVSHK